MSAEPIVIVADPDSGVRNALRIEFSQAQCTVLMAGNPWEAEEYAREADARLVVLDVSRLKLRSFETCARIRRWTGYGDRPIILTVAEVEAKDRAAAEEAGATTLLEKPYSISTLVRAIRRHVAPDDPLCRCLPLVRDGQMEWPRRVPNAWRFSPGSGLARHGQIFPVEAGAGASLPLGRVS
jgi:DNA-binding response OmpR family regulator